MARPPRVGRDEVLFSVAVAGLVAMTVGAVVFGRQSDASLVAAFVGLLGLPIFMTSGRRDE